MEWGNSLAQAIPASERNSVKYLFDIETEKTIDHSEAEGPLKLLSGYAGQNGHRLCMVVPADRKLAAETLLKRLHTENAMIFAV